jgi:hypothetical protein
MKKLSHQQRAELYTKAFPDFPPLLRSSTTVFIYTLEDPRTKTIRYVGKTVDLTKRYIQHIHSAFRYDSYCYRWIKALLLQKQFPIMKVVEIVKIEDWQERERFWIANYPNLTNITEGGTGGDTLTKNSNRDIIRAKLRIIRKGKRNPMYGKKRPDLSARNRALKGTKRPEVGLHNIGRKNPYLSALNKSRKGLHLPLKTRRKISKALKGRLKPYMTLRNKQMSGVNHPFYGKKRPEHSIAMTGRHHTIVTREKMKQSALLLWQQRKKKLC